MYANITDPALDEFADLEREIDALWSGLPSSSAPDPVLGEILSILKNREEPEESKIKDKHLRVLSKQHLLEMILDMDKEIQQLKEENRQLIQVFLAGRDRR